MRIQDKIRNYLLHYLRTFTYSLLARVENSTWVDLPKSAFIKFANNLDILDY